MASMEQSSHSGGERALRANVRLFGDLLGRVLIEQEGQELLALEERIRELARGVRRGGGRVTRSRQRSESSPSPAQGAVLRAFALFFQLANIAEQHHRLRRRREYEHEGRVPRESIADAFASCDAAGGPTTPLWGGRQHAARVVAGRHGAPDGGDAAHDPDRPSADRREAARARRSAACHRRVRPRSAEELAEEITVLWQTDEISARRPRVVDEIRHGLWFFEQSFWDAVPELARSLRRDLPGAPVPLRFGSWIGGDMDGNPNAGAETIEDALERARAARARSLPAGDPEARRGLGYGLDRDRRGAGARRGGDGAVPGRARARSGARSPTTATRTATALLVDLRQLEHALPRASRCADRGRRAGRPASPAPQVFGLHLAALDLRVHAREVRAESERLRAALGRGRARAGPARPQRRSTA